LSGPAPSPRPADPGPPPIDLVCFDLGRVMIRICDGWAHACEQAGVHAPAEAFGEAVHRRLLTLVVEHETGRLSDDGFFQGIAALVGLPAEQVARITDAYLIEPFEGIDPLLAELSAAGVRTACLSNTNARHWARMTATRGPHALPLHRLDYRFASHLVGARKPEPGIYAHVEHATGTDPASIVFFDDAPENVDAALARGWRAHRIDHGPEINPVGQIRRHLATYDLLPCTTQADPT